MRLLQTTTARFETFYSNRPKCAILSHTWGKDEVTYQEILALLAEEHHSVDRPGYKKIVNFRQQARADGYEWVWIDTYCI
jgi:hypothetical protein